MVGSLIATEKSPLVKLRAIAPKVNFYPLVDFVHPCYLHIINFFVPLSSFSLLTVVDRLNSSGNRFGFFIPRFGLSAAILITQFVNLLDMHGSRKTTVRLCGERL